MGRNSSFSQFCVNVVDTDFVQFIDGHRNVDYLICLTYYFCDARQNLTVVDFDTYPYTEFCKHGIDNLHEFNFVQQGI